ncbi:MAG: DUF1080 domain-containing protein [Bacteroidales bacterium]|nr:DUF1080 domain-containing protein [Bacteroidales bacterium]
MKIIKYLLILPVFCVSLFGQAEIKDPLFTEVWGPVPAVVTPGEGSNPPSDAFVLFDGKDLSLWIGDNDKEPAWDINNGVLTVKPGTGGIRTRQAFGDCQLHIEWKTPAKVKGEGQGRGNSGIFFMGQYEIQILDNYNNRTYSNGQAGSVYKDHAPLVNACKAPDEWQSYDIVFTAPKFDEDGTLLKEARFTVFHSGILIHNNVKVMGMTAFIGLHSYTPHLDRLPLGLQDHGNLVSFRNIWIREL